MGRPKFAITTGCLVLLAVSIHGAEQVDKARARIAAGDYASAVDILREYCTKPDASEEDRRLFGEALLGAGLLTEAGVVYERLVRDFPDSAKAKENRLQYAKCREAQGAFEEAIAAYRELIARYGGEIDAYALRLRIVEIYSHTLFDPEKAEAEIQAMLKAYPKDPRNPQSLERIAEVYRSSNNVARAFNLYFQILDNYPKYERTREVLSQAAFIAEDGGLRDYTQAAALYQQYIQTYPEAPDTVAKLARLGTIYRDNLHQYNKAAETFAKVYDKTKQIYFLMEQARSLAQAADVAALVEGIQDKQGATRKAAVIDQIVKEYPNTPYHKEALSLKALCLYKGDRKEEAVATLKEAADKFPDIGTDFSLACWQREIGKPDDAIASFKKILQADPYYRNGEALRLLVDTLVAKDRKLAADYLKAFAKDHASDQGLYLSSLQLLATKAAEPDEAIETDKTMVLEAPDHQLCSARGGALGDLLSRLNEKGRLTDGLGFVQQALAENPFSQNLRLGLVTVASYLVDAKDYDGALKLLANIETALDQASAQAVALLARIAREKEDTETEAAALARAYFYWKENLLDGQTGNALSGRAAELAFLQTHKILTLKKWKMKLDPKNEGEKFQNLDNYAQQGDWFLGKFDESWKEVEVGKPNETNDPCWFGRTFEPTSEDMQYVFKFEKIADEAWVYIDGQTVKYSDADVPFEVKYEQKEAKPFTVVIRVLNPNGKGGILGKCSLITSKKPSGKELLCLGLAQIAQGDTEKSRTILATAPDSESKKAALAYLELLDGAPEKALQAKPAKAEATFYLRVANALKPDQKAGVLAAALKDYPDAPALKVEYARALAAGQQFDKSLEEYTKLISAFPARVRGWLKWEAYNMTLNQWRNFGRARELAEKYAEEEPTSRWQVVLGDHYMSYDPRDFAKAVSCYQAYKVETPEIADRILNALTAAKNFGAVRAYARQWVAKHPGDAYCAVAMQKTVDAMLGVGKPIEALQQLKELLSMYPQAEATSRSVEATLKFFTERNITDPDPASIVREWADSNPTNPAAPGMYIALADGLAAKAPDKAIELYQKVWNNYRSQRDVTKKAGYMLANLLRSRGRFADGQAVFQALCTYGGGEQDPMIIDSWWKVLDTWGTSVPFGVNVDSKLRDEIKLGLLSDGQTDGRNGDMNASWISKSANADHWLELTFEQPVVVGRVGIWWAGPLYVPKTVKVQASDGGDFRDIGTATPQGVETWIDAKAKATKLRIVQPVNAGAAARADLMGVAEVRVARELSEEDLRASARHLRTMAQLYRGTTTSFDALQRLAETLRAEKRFLDSAIVLQEMIFTSPKNNAAFWQRTYAVAEDRFNGRRYGECVALLRSLMSYHNGIAGNELTKAEKLLSDALAKSGVVGIAIDLSLPEAGLLLADMFARTGDQTLAWEYYLKNKDFLAPNIHKVSAAFIQLVVRRHIGLKETAEASSICRQFLIKRGKDPILSASDKAKIQILLGDCYYVDSRYDIARDEYGTVVHAYPDTPEAVDARFKIADTLIAQKIYDKAKEILDAFKKAKDPDVVARAELALGILLCEKGEREEGIEQFKKVLAMAPKGTTVDEIIYRLGSAYKELGKYKEALDTFRLVGLASKTVEKLEPGVPFRIRLSDRNLTTTRGATQIPIIVKTAPGGDEEKLYLEKSDAGEWLFIGEIPTMLGSAKPMNKMLEVTGNDTITYQYDPVFVSNYTVKTRPEDMPTVTIAADAKLVASATEIKEKEELTLPVPRQREAESRAFRKENEVKPGNNIYVMVRDPDRDCTNERDTVQVEVEASSGDRVVGKLLETERHSGKFMGKVATGLKPIDATASDSAEDHSPLYAIDANTETETYWMGALDSRAPKWITVDLKAVYPVVRFSWRRGENVSEKDSRLPLRYTIEMSKDSKTWVPVGGHPPEELKLEGFQMAWNPDGMPLMPGQKCPLSDGATTNRWMGAPDRKQWIVDLDLGSPIVIDKTVMVPCEGPNGVKQYSLYKEKKLGIYPGQTEELEDWEEVYKSEELNPPTADLASFKGRVSSKDKSTIVRARYLRLVITKAAGARPEIGEFEVFPRLYYKDSPDKDRMGGTIDLGGIASSGTFVHLPFDARYVRMTIHEFEDNAPAIASIGIWAKQGKEITQIVPQSGADLMNVAKNEILEMSPGDDITVSYVDEKNISPGETNILHAKLSATFFNGSIAAIKREWSETGGNRTQVERLVYRIAPGDRFIVAVTDYDEDKTDGIDEVPVKVKTHSGATRELVAKETGEMTGIFTKEVDTSREGAEGTLKVEDNDVITISYVDKENSDPGNPTERTYDIEMVTPATGKISIGMAPSPTGTRTGRQPTAPADAKSEVKLVSLEQPLRVVVIDKDMARHTGSTVQVKLTTTGGVEQDLLCTIPAGQLGRQRGAEALQAMLAAVKEGRFEGTIRLALGDKDSPKEIIQSSDEESSGRERSGPGIPVFNVNGQDMITALYVDETYPNGTGAAQRKDFARLISDAALGFFDENYEHEMDITHLGENLYIKVEDSDADRSNECDAVPVLLESSVGDSLKVKLRETLPHSGIFTLSMAMERSAKPVKDEKLQANFGSTITATYDDTYNTESTKSVKREAKIKIVEGSDGQVVSFSQKFPSDQMAIDTGLMIAQCFYELGETHVKLKQKNLADEEFKAAREVLTNLLQVHKEGAFTDRAKLLLACIAEELGEYDDAAMAFAAIVKENAASPVAPEAQYRMGVCYEKKNDYEKAFEQYVALAYRYPNCTFLPEAMKRMGMYYFKKKDYVTSLSIFNKFVERYPDNPETNQVAFKVGLCYILAERYKDGADYFKKYVETHPDSDMVSAALYWAGDSYMKSGDLKQAYRMFKRVVWDYPQTDWAKFARGRLTSPQFDNMQDEEK